MALSVIINETKHKVEKTDEMILSLSNIILSLIFTDNEMVKMNQQIRNMLFSYAEDHILRKIYDDLKIYIQNENSIHLNGYALFRTRRYKEELHLFFSHVLRSLVVKKKYDEFISDMKMYVWENQSGREKIYLKYIDETYELYDENQKSLTDDARLRYLHEFGAGEETKTDFILHYLLDILPAKIVLSHCGHSNFLQTIQLIFGERVVCVN